MRQGATLPELLAAIVLLGLLLVLALPRAGSARDRALVMLHARALAAAHADTRMAAIRRSERTELEVTPARFTLRATGGSVLWTRTGPLEDGVALAGPATPIVFDPRGYSLGAANRTYTLTRGGASARVVISRLGRLRILP